MTTLDQFALALDYKHKNHRHIALKVRRVMRELKIPSIRANSLLRILMRHAALAKLEITRDSYYETQTQQRRARELSQLGDDAMIDNLFETIDAATSFEAHFLAATTSLEHFRSVMLDPIFIRGVLKNITATSGRSGRKPAPFRRQLTEMLVLMYGRYVGHPKYSPRTPMSPLREWLDLWAWALDLPFEFKDKEIRAARETYNANRQNGTAV